MQKADWDEVLFVKPLEGDIYRMVLNLPNELKERFGSSPELLDKPASIHDFFCDEERMLKSSIEHCEKWNELIPSEYLVQALQFRLGGVQEMRQKLASKLGLS